MKNKLSYIGVKALITNKDTVLITQEPTWFTGGGKWELPGGRLAEGEEEIPLEEILLREINEELGDAFTVEVGAVVDVMRRPWNKPGSESNLVFLAVFKCQYKEGDIKLSEENNAYTWIGKDEIAEYEFIDGYKKVLQNYFKNNV